MSKHHLKGFSSYTRRYIRWRDDYKCQFEGCNKYSNECHHLIPKRKAFNKGMRLDDINSPENGIVLCRKHHEFMHKNGNWKYYLKYFRSLIANNSRG